MRSKLLQLTLISVFSLSLLSFTKPGAYDKCLDLRGTFMGEGKKLEDVQVSLLSDGKIVEEYVSKGAKDIKCKLIRDKEYSLVVKKDGYVPAVIVISTQLPKNVTEYNYHVEFTYDMVPQENSLNKEYLDFPVAYVMYYKKKDEFAVSKKYVDHIKERLGKN